MLPQLVLIVLPIPSLLLLLSLSIYHLVPLITLIPSISHSKIISLIPHPRRNLPREFFNLPPRSTGDTESLRSVVLGSKLGIRGKLMILLIGNGIISLACGWGFLLRLDDFGRGGSALLSLSITPLPATISWLAVYANAKGITHSNLVPRILPFSIITTAIITIISIAVPAHSRSILLATSSLFSAGISSACLFAGYQRYLSKPIRLEELPREKSFYAPAISDEQVNERIIREGSDWLTSPSQASTAPSSFSYSPSAKTPRNKRRLPLPGSPNSWLSSPTSTPSSLPSWTYSPSLPSPEPAVTRDRSSSPVPQNLPQPRPHAAVKGSATTVYTARTYTTGGTPGSALSPGGSILADYEPDPFHPLPRGFESLTSYPISPSRMMSGSRISLATQALRSKDTLACVPVSKTSSTYTLEMYHSSSEAFTPIGRRAPPPPPIPTDMPLPPTPTASHSGRSWGWQGKDSTELLMGEREWVEVDHDVDGIDGWGEGGKGVGVVGLAGVLICYGLNIPLLLFGFGTLPITLYLISLILPSPMLILTSYLLRYRPVHYVPRSSSTSQTTKPSLETHRSLALISDSQLSLPISISPKLTPPAPNRSASPQRLSKLVNPKPSVSNFGYVRTERRHTVYGGDMYAEEELRRTLARRSGDVWIESGHAREGGSVFSRAAEMLKPVPALRVLESSPREGTLSKLRGGVVSMLPKRLSEYVENTQNVTIEVTSASPTKVDRRTSAVSAEIQTATRARMSSSPTFFYGQPQQNQYELDWLSAGILPGLIPNIKIGADVRVEGRPEDLPQSQLQSHDAESTPRSHRVTKRHSIDTPRSNRHSSSTHGYTSSIDISHSQEYYTASYSTPSEFRHRTHKQFASLPGIDAVDFDDVRRSFDECGRDDLDLPPFPSDKVLTPVTEEGSGSGVSSVARNEEEAFEDAEVDMDEEEMAEEMERVMAMDTPTRASFVISPPPSEYSTTSFSRSGRSTPVTTEEKDIPPVPIVPTAFNHAITSHPHPPPQVLAPIIAQPKPGHLSLTVAIEPHPPVPHLANKKSTETLHSVSTMSSSDPTPTKIPEFQPSKRDLLLVKQLKSRAAISGNDKPTASEKASNKEIAARRAALKPLQLVDKNLKRLSEPIKSTGKVLVTEGEKRSSVLESHIAGKSGVVKLPRDKENVGMVGRKSKPSAGSGVTVLRA